MLCVVTLAGIHTAHQLAGIPLDLRGPMPATVVEDSTRSHGTRPARQTTPAVPEVLRLLLAADPSARTALAARDRARLLLGFGAALRRSELVALRVGDADPVPGCGLRLLVRRSKNDQHGQFREVVVWVNPAELPLCPAFELDAWLGYLFLAGDLDGSAVENARQERPLPYAVTKAGRQQVRSCPTRQSCG